MEQLTNCTLLTWTNCIPAYLIPIAQVVAAKDQVLPVRAAQSRTYGILVSANCRVCGMVPEYVDHLLSSCTPLVATVYKQKHDRVASIVHWSLLKCYNLSVPSDYWDHTTAAAVNSPDVKVLWSFNIFTDPSLGCPVFRCSSTK